MRDTKVKLSLILLVIMIVFTTVASYAYFTSSPGVSNYTNVDLESAETGGAYIQAGSTISLLVTGEQMAQHNASSITPAFEGENTTPVKIVLKTGDDGGELKCSYDIAYVPETPFMNSSLNVTNLKEFTIKGIENLKNNDIPETDLGNATSKVLLLDDYPISLTGVNKKLEQEWVFTVGFYNHTFNQDDNANIDFGGKIIIEDIKCENIF